MAADGSEHHSAATNNLAGGEERSWEHKARPGGRGSGWGRMDRWMKQSSHITSVWGSLHTPPGMDSC